MHAGDTKLFVECFSDQPVDIKTAIVRIVYRWYKSMDGIR